MLVVLCFSYILIGDFVELIGGPFFYAKCDLCFNWGEYWCLILLVVIDCDSWACGGDEAVYESEVHQYVWGDAVHEKDICGFFVLYEHVF